MVRLFVIIAKPKNHQQALGLEHMAKAYAYRHNTYVQVHYLWKLSDEKYQRLVSAINKVIDEEGG